eukprot:scaffold244588_cov43-Attheya_sp.AAC.5
MDWEYDKCVSDDETSDFDGIGRFVDVYGVNDDTKVDDIGSNSAAAQCVMAMEEKHGQFCDSLSREDAGIESLLRSDSDSSSLVGLSVSSFSICSDDSVGDRNDSDRTFEDEELLEDTTVWGEEEEMLFEEAIDNIERSSHFCQNCWRYDFVPDRPLNISLVKKGKISKRFPKFNFLPRRVSGDVEFSLCYQCQKAFCKSDTWSEKDKKLSWRWLWPSYIWRCVVLNDRLWEVYGSEKIWSLFPSVWRIWWRHSIERTRNLDSESLSDSIQPVWEDVTTELHSFEAVSKRNLIAELKDQMSTYCVHDLRCPWGDTFHFREHGSVPLDLVLRRYFRTGIREPLPVISSCRKAVIDGVVDLLKGVREDFLSFDDVILGWPIRRCLIVDEVHGAVILTCNHHDGGDPLSYVHPVGNPLNGIWPSRKSDQLAQAVLVPKTVRTMQHHAHNLSYEIRRCDGGFDGLDTCYVARTGRFEPSNMSMLLDGNEQLSLQYRPDIVCLLDRLVERGVLPVELAESKKTRSRELFSKDFFQQRVKKYTGGGTFISLAQSVELLKGLQNGFTGKNRYHNNVTDCYEIGSFVLNWPSLLIYCHPIANGYGAPFHRVVMSGRQIAKEVDVRALWVVLSFLMGMPDVWSCVSNSVIMANRWHGWILVYASYYVLNVIIRQQGTERNPYRRPIFNLKKLMEKLFLDGVPDFKLSDVNTLMEDVQGVEVTTFDLIDGLMCFDAEIDGASCQVVLVLSDETLDVNINPPLEVKVGEYDYELRYAMCLSGGRMNWDAKWYCRHGGLRFPNWWYQTRRTGLVQVADLPSDVFDEYSILGYVRKETSCMKAIRDDYFRHLGGQTDVLCGLHFYPLVQSKFGTSRVCECFENCKRKCLFLCPKESCSVSVCKHHFNNVKDDAIKHQKVNELSPFTASASSTGRVHPPRFGADSAAIVTQDSSLISSGDDSSITSNVSLASGDLDQANINVDGNHFKKTEMKLLF